MRHTAWLQAAPRAPDNSKAEPVSRLKRQQQERGDARWQPPMPPVHAGHHLLGYLWEVGPTMPAGMVQGPVTQQELAAWQVNTGIQLQAWEARALRTLSVAYLGAWSDAQAPDAPPPWRPEPSAQQLNTVADTLRDRLRKWAR